MLSQEESFLDHLEELRKRIFIALAAVGVSSAVLYLFSKQVLDFLISPLRRFQETELYFTSPYEGFLVHLKVSLLGGLLLASPVVFTQLWQFVAPGLYEREKRLVFPLAAISAFLFICGAAFAFWVLVPLGLQFLLSFRTEYLRPLLGIGPYASFLIGMVLACGIVFDLPVVVLGLVRARVLGAEALRRSRRVVIVLIFVLAAVLTPSPDPVSQILLAVPLFFVFEISVWAAKWLERKK